MIKLMYISGKYTGQNKKEVAENISLASAAGKNIIDMYPGYFPIIPHNNTAHFEDHVYQTDIDYDYWLNGYIELLERCDAIYMLRNWRESNGAMKEYKQAVKLNKEVYFQ